MRTKLTPEQKQQIAEQKRIERLKNQKPVREIRMSIEWKKSRMWGHNPHLEAYIIHEDGTSSNFTSRASGCGYDKESQVIADCFNNCLAYKLFELKEGEQHPYGIYIGNHYHYSGGIGTNCYYDISKAIGFEFKKVASGKTYDAFNVTKL